MTTIGTNPFDAVIKARQAVSEAETFLHRALDDALAACAREGLGRRESARRLGIPVRTIDRDGRRVRSLGETRRLLGQAFNVTDYDDVDALRGVLQQFTGVPYDGRSGESMNVDHRRQWEA